MHILTRHYNHTRPSILLFITAYISPRGSGDFVVMFAAWCMDIQLNAWNQIVSHCHQTPSCALVSQAYKWERVWWMLQPYWNAHSQWPCRMKDDCYMISELTWIQQYGWSGCDLVHQTSDPSSLAGLGLRDYLHHSKGLITLSAVALSCYHLIDSF